MVEETNEPLDAQKSITLKLDEPIVDSESPWSDDLLGRQEIAQRLTNLVATQKPPLTISLHGQWGTGKTFLLKRWQKDLERQEQGFRAIYFNAWEDDFCHDPLLAILGQLSDYFKETGLGAMARKVAELAMPLVRENLLGIAKTTIGVTLKVDTQTQSDKSLLDAYLEQNTTKNAVKGHLVQLSRQVADDTGHPLIFIVDELDRCRPTFAIELLERVKHIFDVPNLVFLFGINRDELCRSLASVYGEIKTDIYLRRFFDFEFNLPDVDSQGFARHLIDRFQLVEVFQGLDEKLQNPDQPFRRDPRNHMDEYNNYRRTIPGLWSALGLTLRDIDYGIRLLALLARNLTPATFTHPGLMLILVAMKFKDPDSYFSLVAGTFRTREIMNYIEGELRHHQLDLQLSYYLDRIEGFLYCAEGNSVVGTKMGESARAELQGLLNGKSKDGISVLSHRAQNADRQQLQGIIHAIDDGRRLYISPLDLREMATLIDIYQMDLRR